MELKLPNQRDIIDVTLRDGLLGNIGTIFGCPIKGSIPIELASI